MDVYRRRIQMESTTHRQIFALLSDLHLDAADHDRDALMRDLEAARALNARISINGDIFDAIVPSDRKRHHPSVSHANPERDDIFNQLVQMAVDVLGPYADLIDVISPGNHERSVLKYHHIDLISMLIFALNQRLPDDAQRIHQGSYRGFQQYIFNHNRFAKSFVIFRHHGRGGAAPVTGGALDLDRIRKDFDADLYWMGHKHGSIGRKFTRVAVGPQGHIYTKSQRACMSAGYKSRIGVENPNVDGDIADFGEQFYGTTEQGAQWCVLDVRHGSSQHSRDFERHIRWSISDSPQMLLEAASA